MGCGNCHHWVWSTNKGPSAFVDFTAAHTPKHVTHGSMRWLRLICTPYTNYTPYMHYIIVTWRAALLASSHCFFHLVGPKSQVETISWNSQLCVAATPIAWRFWKLRLTTGLSNSSLENRDGCTGQKAETERTSFPRQWGKVLSGKIWGLIFWQFFEQAMLEKLSSWC